MWGGGIVRRGVAPCVASSRGGVVSVDRGGAGAEHRSAGPSTVVLFVVLAAAGLGAISLARQPRIARLANPQPAPAWAVTGHDSARTGHTPYAAPAAPTLLWGPLSIAAPVAHPPIIDGSHNVYVARSDGGLLFFKGNSNGDTNWCPTERPITDTLCAGPSPSPSVSSPKGGNALVRTTLSGLAVQTYVVDGRGGLAASDTTSPLSSTSSRLLDVPQRPPLAPDAGLVSGRRGSTLYLYGVRVLASRSSYAVTALGDDGRPVRGWRETPIASRGLTPVSIAPDGTLLVAASAPEPGGAAALYALDTHGRALWRLPLAPGLPSYVTVQGTSSGWTAWVAVTGAARSWVVVAYSDRRPPWRWSVGHPLDVTDGGVALAQPTVDVPLTAPITDTAAPPDVGYVAGTVGIYALDAAHHHAWLFFDTRRVVGDIPGPPITDKGGTMYVATRKGHVYAVRPADGQPLWRYDTGRDARGPLLVDSSGALIVMSRDTAGAAYVEALGANGGTALTVTMAVACARLDCPTATPTPPTTATPLATATLPATLTASPATATVTPTAPLTVTSTASSAPTSTTLTTPATLTAMPAATLSPSPSATGTGNASPTP